MLNKDQMSPKDLALWKESSSWYFDHLKELQSSLDERVAEYAKNVLICNSHQLENTRLQTAALAGQASLLQGLIDMEYSDIVEDKSNED